MSQEKSRRPISAAFGKATGVFTRPKLQRRPYTTHAASELISAVRLANVVPESKENFQEEKPPELIEENNNNFTTLSPCLATWNDIGSVLVNSTPNGTDQEPAARKNNVSTDDQINKAMVTKHELKNELSLQCLQVKEIIKSALNMQLCNMEYSHRECGEKGRLISQLIEKSVKALSTALYKVTVVVYIGALRDEGIELACQCSWSPGLDFFAMDSYKNESIFASGVVFATLYE